MDTYKNNSFVSKSINNYDSIVYNTRQYTKQDTKSDGTTGMAALLDTTFNLLIGSKTKYLWKATTILGVNPSNFMTTYQKGDMYQDTYQYVYTDTYYCFTDKKILLGRL